jgi:ABC-type branched-subunit amino acid transport system permease subunit
MNRFARETGEPASIYGVCLRFWLLVCLGLAVVAAVTLVMGPIHSAVRLTTLLLWTLFGGAVLMVAIRHWTVTRPRKKRREAAQR